MKDTLKAIYVHDSMTEYVENTADERSFIDILQTILNETGDKTREDVKELYYRYGRILSVVDRVYLNAGVDD